MKTEVTLSFETDQPMQVDRVLFEALQRAVRYGVLDHDLEILSTLLIAAIRAENNRWEESDRVASDHRETETINHAVIAALKGEVPEEGARQLGRIRTDKIEDAISKWANKV